MPGSPLFVLVGVIAVTAAAAWWSVRALRRRPVAVRLRRVVARWSTR